MQLREFVELVGTDTGRRWIVRTFRQRLHSERISIQVRRDMDVPFTPEPAEIPLEVREVRPDDDLSFLEDVPGLPAEAAQHRADQRWLLEAGLPNCFVAVDTDGAVCYMAWLLFARDNQLIQARWGNWLPQLGSDEALIEGVYVSTRHRGKGIMTDASCKIADQAHAMGVRYVLGVIGADNIAPLRSAKSAGFHHYRRRVDRWRFFRRRIEYQPIDTP
ncbi:N-acetyltransferase family protein [Mycobacterium sp. C3-094]